MISTPRSDCPPPFALPELLERCMGSTDVAALVLDKFEIQLREDVGAIASLITAHDAVQIARKAHALKGAAGSVAAQTLRVLAAQVESSAKQDRLDAIAGDFAALRSEIERCLTHLPGARHALLSGIAPSREVSP